MSESHGDGGWLVDFEVRLVSKMFLECFLLVETPSKLFFTSKKHRMLLEIIG